MPLAPRPSRRPLLARVAPALALCALLLSACAASAEYAPSPGAYAMESAALEPAAAYELADEEADGGGGFFDGIFGGADDDRAELNRGRRVAAAKQAQQSPPPGGATIPDAETGGTAVEAPKTSAAARQTRRLMIYKAAYTVMVASVESAVEQLTASVEARGGYLSGRQDGTLTVRVPAARFFEVLELLPSYGRVVTQNLQALDVTKQVADLKLRVANARAARARLVTLLEQAVKVEDILKIEQELRRLTDEIEGMEAQLKGLGDQIAFSTLQVTFQPNAPDPTPTFGRRYSRFDWINQIGMEAVHNGF